MEDSIIAILAEGLVIFFVFVWVPWVCFSTAYFYTGAALAPLTIFLDFINKNRALAKPSKQDTRPKAAPAPVLSKRSKKTKGSYPVVDSFDEAHRIVNPVEFDA
mgnify:CR=1 FL=1|tara:strand:+ start:357 stop:668 length:312 start_codon:yes stop_codon:yes gene_type:complete